MNPIILQTISYVTVLVLALAIIGWLQKGFFWKFFAVKKSFGALVMVKIREANRDRFAVGKIVEKTIVFKVDKKERRIVIPDSGNSFYRAIGITWVDVDGDTSGVCKVDYSAVTGFDAEKYNNLYLRALYKPKTADTMERVIIALLLLVAVVAGIGIFMTISKTTELSGQIATLTQTVGTISKGIITGTSSI